MCNCLVEQCQHEKGWNMIIEEFFVQSKAGMYPTVVHISNQYIMVHLAPLLLETTPSNNRILSDFLHNLQAKV